jgi:DNA repair protein RecO (recombination protein O)
MNVLSSESIVLRQRDFKDRDRLVTVLTRDRGKLSGIAKGAKVITGRSVGAYEPFTRCILHYVDKPSGGLVNIRKCDPLPPFLFPVRDYERYLHLTYYTELVELSSVSPSDSEAYFELLARTLQRTVQVPLEQLPLLRLEFELDLLQVLGWQPEWKRCIQCGKPIFVRKDGAIHPDRLAPHQFDAQAGGLRCPDCREPHRRHLHDLSPGALAQFAQWRAVRGEDAPPPAPPALAELERAVTAHLLHHLERKPQSLDLLESTAKEAEKSFPEADSR